MCSLGVKRSCAHLAKGVCQVVYKVLVVGVHKSGKENLKRFAWGLDVGHKDRTRINLVCLRLSFLRFVFLFMQVTLFT